MAAISSPSVLVGPGRPLRRSEPPTSTPPSTTPSPTTSSTPSNSPTSLSPAPGFGEVSASRSKRLSGPASSEEVDIVAKCLMMFYRARAERRPLVAQWNKNYRVLCNRTWLQDRPSFLPSPEVPEIYPILASQVGWVTDQRPTLQVAPSSEPFSPHYEYFSRLAHDLQTTMQASLFNQAFEAQAEQSVWDGFLYGTAILKTTWDGTMIGGLGDAVIRRVDPYTFYPDPQATSQLDANYFVEAYNISVQEMDRRWPGSAGHIRPGVQHDVDQAPGILDISSTGPMAIPASISPATGSAFSNPGAGRLRAVEEPGVTILEFWLRDHEYITLPNTNVESVKESWRVVVVAGDRILMNEKAEDLWSHGSHPYDCYTPHSNGQFWGYSIVEWLIPSQLAINRLLASFMFSVDLSSNPIFMESTGSGIPRAQITNKPGGRLTVNDVDKAKWLQPPQTNHQLFQLIEFFVNEMERISGLTAISRGMAPGGRQAADVVDQIQESSFVRIRLMLRNFERALQSAGSKMASLICENYTQPRLIQVVGSQAEQSSLSLTGFHFYTPTPEGRLPMRFNLKVEAGSTLATARHARIAEADFLYSVGAIDEIALLEAHDFPNRAAVAKRVMEAKAMGMMQPPGARQRAGRSS